MRKKTLLISGTSALLIAGTILVSCNKNVDLKSTNTATAVQASSSVAQLADLVSRDDISLAEAALSNYSADALGTINCHATATYDFPEGTYPRTVTVDWGTTNCYMPRTGGTRRGKVITTYFGDMSDTAATSYYVQTYEDYYVNDVKIEGTVKMSHNARKKKSEPQNIYRQTYKNRKATQVDGEFTIMNGYYRLTKQVDDGEYPGPLLYTGVFRSTGTIVGDVVPAVGSPYQWKDSIDEANPLVYNNCKFIVKGKRQIDYTNQSSWTIDYGRGACDDQATKTVDGITTTITLPFFRNE